jgi:hypothetical protein
MGVQSLTWTAMVKILKKIIAHKEAAMERQTFGLAHQFDV